MSCQQFERLGGQTYFTPKKMQAAINQENLFSTSSCKLINAYMYGSKTRKESWEVVDIMVKEAIDSSGVFNTILLESHQDYKEFNGTFTIISPSLVPEFLLSFNPPIMFRAEGLVIMSAEAMENPMGLQRVLGKKYVEEYFIGDVYHDIFNHDPKYKSMMYRSKPLHNGVQLEKSKHTNSARKEFGKCSSGQCGCFSCYRV